MIVRVKGAQASVLVTEYHPENESNRIHLRIDKIDTSASLAHPAIDTQEGIDNQAEECELELLGHIETRGDVSAKSGWLGNPNTALRLEGFAANWLSKPDGLTWLISAVPEKAQNPRSVSPEHSSAHAGKPNHYLSRVCA